MINVPKGYLRVRQGNLSEQVEVILMSSEAGPHKTLQLLLYSRKYSIHIKKSKLTY